MPEPRRPKGRATLVPLLASGVLHVSVLGVGAHVLLSSPPLARPVVGTEFAVETWAGDSVAMADLPGDVIRRRAPDEPPRVTHSGANHEPRPDTQERGRGGTREARDPAAHLSDSIDGLTLATDPSLLSERSQISRLETDAERRSREDRRATPNPMELTFVATGSGVRKERRLPAPTDPSRGTLGALPLVSGARPHPDLEPDSDALDLARVPDPRAPGAERTSALGVPDGSRPDAHRRSAAVAIARPAVRQGRASISTASRGRPSDNVDSSLAVAGLVQSLVSASSAGGPRGEGEGGDAALGAPGSQGASGAGARVTASGEGGPHDGAVASGVTGYVASVNRKVYPYWEHAFPSWAIAEGRGGVAVIGVTLDQDGRVRGLRVVRGSGFPEFDSNVARALELASPYGPLPPAVRHSGLTLHIAFDAMNPAVGRSGPGPGRR